MPSQQMQAGPEAEMWGQLQRGEPVPQPGVQFARIEGPIYQAPLFPGDQTVGANPSMSNLAGLKITDNMLGGHQEQVQQHVKIEDQCSSSYAASNLHFTGQQNVRVPASMPGPIRSETAGCDEILNDIRAQLLEEHHKQNTQQGMAFSRGVRPTVGQPSSTSWGPPQVPNF
jgi:hypothetical protein